MPRTVLSTTSNGSTNQWEVVGAPTAWEAVAYNSTDSNFIQSNSSGDLSEFNCGAGYQPIGGRLMAVTVHYRMRATAASTGAVVDVNLLRGGAPHSVGSVALTTSNWVDGEIRLREDWVSGQRFTLPEVADLGVSVSTNTAPSSGIIQVSQLWIATEYVEGPNIYDPYDGLLPDVVTGPLNWITGGAAPATITGNHYLRIDSYSPNNRIYTRETPTEIYAPKYISELEVRLIISNVTPIEQIAYGFSAYEKPRPVNVQAMLLGGIKYLVLTNQYVATSDTSKWPGLIPFDFEDVDLHLRLKIDRDDTSGNMGDVELYVNYADTPIMTAGYYDFPEGPASPGYEFLVLNNPDTNARVELDYYSRVDYPKYGSLFRSWHDLAVSTNEVTADPTDNEIIKPVVISPPGVTAGQSEYACLLAVSDSDHLCETSQKYALPAAAPQTYKLEIDCKQDVLVNVDLQVVIQRFPDLYYWDDTLKVWDPSPQAMIAPASATRATAALASGLSVPSTENILLITVKTKVPTGSPVVHNAWIYKVYLDEE